MPITTDQKAIIADQIAPLLRGTYTDPQAARWVFQRILLPRFRPCLEKLWRPDVGGDRASFALDVLADLWARVVEKAGLTPPSGEVPRDWTRWLAKVVHNAGRDRLRASRRDADRRREVEFDEAKTRPPCPVETASPEGGREALHRLRERSPLYALGLFCWTDPGLIDRALLDAASRQTRGRSAEETGLVRDVDEALTLLGTHRRALSNGLERNAEAQTLAGWILRSSDPDFSSWCSDPRRVKQARETLSKWNRRGRQALVQMRASPPTATEEGDP